jgi:hypothetical protein
VVVPAGVSVQSVNGPEFTTIEGGSAVRCVYLRHSQVVADAALSGFTLTNGNADAAVLHFPEPGMSLGGGIYREPDAYLYVITNCIITHCYACYGGGAYGTTLWNCTQAGNSGSFGGGLILILN